MGTKEKPGEFDCYHLAEPDEPHFTVLARDVCAPATIETWAYMRCEIGKNQPNDRQILETYKCANAMHEWRQKNRPNAKTDMEWRQDEDNPYTHRLLVGGEVTQYRVEITHQGQARLQRGGRFLGYHPTLPIAKLIAQEKAERLGCRIEDPDLSKPLLLAFQSFENPPSTEELVESLEPLYDKEQRDYGLRKKGLSAAGRRFSTIFLLHGIVRKRYRKGHRIGQWVWWYADQNLPDTE